MSGPHQRRHNLTAERVAAETAGHELLDDAPCGFVSFRDDSRVVYINSTLCDRLGYTRDEVVGRHLEMLFGVGSRIFLQTHFLPLVKLHGRAQEVFMLLRSRNGVDVGMLCNAKRQERGGDAITDCVFMEVQERRKFEDALLQAKQAAEQANAALAATSEQLRQQTKEADEANKAKSTFLAVMSHELRTPLNAIGGYVQLLEMGVHGPITGPQKDTLARIDRAQRHLLRLINDVLNLARIEAGRVDYLVEPVSLGEVISMTLPMVEPQAASRGLSLRMIGETDAVARADRDKVQQIVLNLLTNAVKFTARGGSVRVEAGHHSPSQVFVSVSDTGTGIPEEMLEKVFEPFIQVDSAHSKPGEGTGLGLAISRDLARGMQGDLLAQSTLGVGSTFELLLPRES